MNKPDWKDAPDWARYLGRGVSGAWYWYEAEPIPLSGEYEGLWSVVGRIAPAPCKYEMIWEERPR